MELSVQALDETTVLVIAGECDLSNRDQLESCLASLDGPLAVDLAGVPFFDSSSIGLLVTHHRRLEGALTIRNPQQNVRRVLEVVALDHWIEPA